MPAVAAAGIIAGASMAGLPPLLGFVGKESIFAALLELAHGETAGVPGWAGWLVVAAVIAAVEQNPITNQLDERPVAEMLAEASRADAPLDDLEAMELEAFIAARREPTLATAIDEARTRWRTTIAGPLIERASQDGSASPDADFDSLVYLVQTLQLGLYVQRGAGQHAPDAQGWQRFIERLLRTMAHPEVE